MVGPLGKIQGELEKQVVGGGRVRQTGSWGDGWRGGGWEGGLRRDNGRINQQQKINGRRKTDKIVKCQTSSTCAYAHLPFSLGHSCNKKTLLFQC